MPAGLDVRTPEGRFRRLVRVALPTGGHAAGLEILGAASFTAIFTSRTVNALSTTAPERAELHETGEGLVLSLPAARRVARVRTRNRDPRDRLAAFRFDGPVVSEEPVAAGADSSRGVELGVTDRQLIMRRTRGGPPFPLPPGDVVALFLGYDAPNPRIGFALVGDGAGDEFLPADADDLPAGTVAAGSAFAAPLSARIARFAETRPDPLPDPLALNLILEADLPCSARLSAFDLAYALTVPGFAGSDGKRRLRFPGGRRTGEAVGINVPPGAIFLCAPGRFTRTGGGAVPAGLPTPDADLAGGAADEGVALLPQALTATRIELDAAQVVTGASARIAGIEDATVSASLWSAGSEGMPGQLLTRSAAVAVASARPSSIHFPFPAAATPPPGTVWLGFAAESGRAVLALRNGGSGQIVQIADAKAALVAAADGRGAAAHLLHPAAPGEPRAPEAGLAVATGGEAAPLVAEDGGRTSAADLARQLNALPGSRPERVQLEVTSEQGGVVAVEPGQFRYRLA